MDLVGSSTLDLSKLPAGIPPSGTVSNLIDPPSQAWIPKIAIYTTLPVAIALVIARIYSRFRFHHGYGADDYLLVVAAVTITGFNGLILYFVQGDMFGRHMWDIPVSEITGSLMKRVFALMILYSASSAILKIALCFLYRRIFLPDLRSTMMIWFGIIFVFASYLALICAWIAFAVPRPNDGGWTSQDLKLRSGEASPKISLATAYLSLVTDFYILAIPLTTVMRLKMNRSSRIGVCAVFLIGLLACSFVAASLKYRYDIIQALDSDAARIGDSFWLSMPPYALIISELNIGVVCTCIPIVFPLCRAAIIGTKTLLSSYHTNSKRNRGVSELDQTDLSSTSGRLPNAPKATLTGLASFGQGKNSVRFSSSQNNLVDDHNESDCYPLQSVDMEYHGHLVSTLPINQQQEIRSNSERLGS